MLRIHFTSEDLTRVRLTAGMDPMWEIVLSRFRLHDPDLPLAFRPWRAKLRGVTGLRASAGVLATLAPKLPYFPDFLTPAEGEETLDAGLDAIMTTPRERLHAELARLRTQTVLPAWVDSVADGTGLRAVTEALRAYHDVAIAPFRPVIEGSIDADRAHRTRSLLNGGIEGLLATLRPLVRWRPPVLEVACDVERTVRLRGRGLRLRPSFFCQRNAVSLANPDLPPVLVYPIAQEYRWVRPGAGDSALPALLGRARAAVLRTVDDGRTTSQIAGMLGMSVASASRHTGVLRAAGFIDSRRDGPAVLHRLTPLGAALLSRVGRDS
ncbi:ArsR/SmtB family transcription factor [Actinophytocola sp.]|uniref:ArsR/SmtB family transcription factor n=1 Tax=Actinophytocola sp. TaxID=1872138 RepID=UPI00389B2C2D